MPRRRAHLLLAAATLAGCAQEPAETALEAEPPCQALHWNGPPARDVVLVVNDTMRRDAVGIHGGAAHTPHFDRFAREHLLFDAAFAPAPWTKPSVASLFTSLHPSQHGLASDPQLRGPATESLEADALAEPFVTLAELLRDAGFRTGAFVANPWLRARYGFAQGFEHYDDSFVDRFAAWPASGGAVVDAALAWLREREPRERVFLYVHLLDSHGPYGSIPADSVAALRARTNRDPQLAGPDGNLVFADMRTSDGTPLRDAGFRPTRTLMRETYRLGIEAFDRLFGRLRAGIEAVRDWERLALVVTSDHGEALYERGYGLHGHGLHDDELAVPLAARLPGAEPARGRIACLTGLVDVMPTLCTVLDVACPPGLAGWSLVDPPASARRWIVTEGVMRRPSHRAVRNRRFTLIHEPDGRRDGRRERGPFSLMELRRDGAVDVLEARADDERTRRAFAVLRTALDEAVAERPAPTPPKVPLAPGDQARLEALGYLRARAPSEGPTGAAR